MDTKKPFFSQLSICLIFQRHRHSSLCSGTCPLPSSTNRDTACGTPQSPVVCHLSCLIWRGIWCSGMWAGTGLCSYRLRLWCHDLKARPLSMPTALLLPALQARNFLCVLGPLMPTDCQQIISAPHPYPQPQQISDMKHKFWAGKFDWGRVLCYLKCEFS